MSSGTIVRTARRITTKHKKAILERAEPLNGKALSHDFILELCCFAEEELGIRVMPLTMRRLLSGRRNHDSLATDTKCKRRSLRSIWCITR